MSPGRLDSQAPRATLFALRRSAPRPRYATIRHTDAAFEWVEKKGRFG